MLDTGKQVRILSQHNPRNSTSIAAKAAAAAARSTEVEHEDALLALEHFLIGHGQTKGKQMLEAEEEFTSFLPGIHIMNAKGNPDAIQKEERGDTDSQKINEAESKLMSPSPPHRPSRESLGGNNRNKESLKCAASSEVLSSCCLCQPVRGSRFVS